MFVKAFPSGPFQTNCYLIGCPETQKAVIVDPAPDVLPSLRSEIQLHPYEIVAIWLTHSHWDHIGDLAKVKALWPVPVAVHPLDEGNVKNPGSDGLPCWISIDGVVPDHHFFEGEMLRVGNLNFRVIHTPGHTPGGVCLYCEKEKVLISGDTLFKGSIGNLSFPTSCAEDMWKSLSKLEMLPKDTQVFPGHGGSTHLSQESWLKNAKNIFG